MYKGESSGNSLEHEHRKKEPNKHRSRIDYRPEVAFIYRSTQSMDLNSEETSYSTKSFRVLNKKRKCEQTILHFC